MTHNSTFKPLARVFVLLAAALCLGFACLTADVAQATPSYEAGSTTSTATAKKYPIVYKLNGGTQPAKQVLTVKKGKSIKVSKLKKPTRTNYKFLGWYKNKALTKKATKLTGAAKKSTRTVYAKWKVTKYNIIYSLNGGKFSGSYKKTIKVNKTIDTSTLKKPKRAGYTFKTWCPKSTLKSQARTIQGVADPAKRTLYAKWATNTYTITYETNGGMLPKKAKSTYKTSKGLADLPVPTRAGYSFLGWYADPAFATKVSSIEAETYGNRTLYARWIERYVIAHRGYHQSGAAQNSVDAYRAAAEKGFTHVETDIRFTKDNVAVLSHDATKKVYKKDMNGDPIIDEFNKGFDLAISSVTLDELQNDYIALSPSGVERPANTPEAPSTDEKKTSDSTAANDIVAAIENAAKAIGDALAAAETTNADGDDSDSDGDDEPTEPEVPTPVAKQYYNVSLFTDFLDVCKELNLVPHIELKEGSAMQIASLVREVDKRGMTYSVCWSSFHPELLQYVKAWHSRSTFMYLAQTISNTKVNTALALADSGGSCSIGLNAANLSDTYLGKCQKASVPLCIWTLANESLVANYDPYIFGFSLNDIAAAKVPAVI